MDFFIDAVLPLALEGSFTYKITQEEAAYLEIGMRVAVPFGKNKIYTALVVGIHNEAPEIYEAKEIQYILDDKALVSEFQLKHWQWIASYYMCTLGEVFKSAMPKAFLLESETFVVAAKEMTEEAPSDLKDDEYLVFEALQHQSALRVKDIASILNKKTVLPILNRLIAKKIIALQEEVQEKYKPKFVKYISIDPDCDTEELLLKQLDQLSRAKKQQQVLLWFLEYKTGNNRILFSELKKKVDPTGQAIKALVKKKVFKEEIEQEDRISYEGEEVVAVQELNLEQQNALQIIKEGFHKKQVALLYGVTSSGKTEVYVQLIKDCLEKGEQALFLLPEIALTTQLIKRMQLYFGDKVAVYHSKYNIQERAEVWQNVLEHKDTAQLVIGARSSLFLPFKKLGVIVVDEEHESSFKQYDPAPRYHARDAAIVLGNIHNAAVLLGSATPSIESFYNAKRGKYALAVLKHRFANVLLPDMELVSLKEQYKKKKMKGHFSERLRECIEETLLEGKQIILFQNRRGFSPVMECTSCGHCPQCTNCDVSLTYHQYKNQLRCHYCGYYSAVQQNCSACNKQTLSAKGLGTEQIEEEFKELYPQAKVGRMDLDTTRGKNAYEKIITAFENGDFDVLVGTQMLSKGLDFRNVDLVGVMNADNLLNFPDFRAHERSYQLITQVAGRAGRTQKQGKVIIQTYNPYHQILQQITTGDYNTMFKEQFYDRRQYGYPPSNRLIKVILKHRDYTKLEQAATWLATALSNVWSKEVLGPEAPIVSRVRNQYIKNIIIKIPQGRPLDKTKKSIKRIEKSFNAVAYFRGVRVIYNVDPL